MTGEMETERVYILKHALNTAIDIALLWFSLCSKNMRYFLFLFHISLIIFQEKVPTERWLHVVNKGSLLIKLFLGFLLLLSAIWLSQTS